MSAASKAAVLASVPVAQSFARVRLGPAVLTAFLDPILVARLADYLRFWP